MSRPGYVVGPRLSRASRNADLSATSTGKKQCVDVSPSLPKLAARLRWGVRSLSKATASIALLAVAPPQVPAETCVAPSLASNRAGWDSEKIPRMAQVQVALIRHLWRKENGQPLASCSIAAMLRFRYTPRVLFLRTSLFNAPCPNPAEHAVFQRTLRTTFDTFGPRPGKSFEPTPTKQAMGVGAMPTSALGMS